MSMRREVTTIVRDWPSTGWLTEAELGEALAADAHPVWAGSDGAWRYRNHRIRGLLNDARRTGWLLRQQTTTPPTYKPTPMGVRETAHQPDHQTTEQGARKGVATDA